MANLILPDPRMEMPELLEPGRKPIGPVEVDRSNKMGRSIYGYTLFRNNLLHVDSDGFIDSAINPDAFFLADYMDAGGTGVSGDDAGFAINTVASEYEQSTGGDELFNAWTVVFRAKQAGYNISRIFTSNPNLRPSLYFERNNPDTVVLHGGNAVAVQGTFAGLDLADGNWHTISCHYRGRVSGTDCIIAVDGRWSAVSASPNVYNPHCNYYFGSYHSNGAYSAGLQYRLVVFHKWKNQYSQNELIDYSADPYQFLIPA